MLRSVFMSMMALAAIGLVFAWSTAVFAGAPVAVIEDASDDIQNVALFEFVEAGRIIELGDKGRLVLGYLSGCNREEITGGQVTIGTKGSTVSGGKVKRETVECDGGGLRLTSEQKGKSGVLVMRAGKGSGAAGEKKPTLTVYGASPVILAAGAEGTAIIERLDRDGPKIQIGLNHGVADLAAARQKLVRGGIYRAAVGKREIVFRVDRYARPGPEPLLSRLVRL
jgi:hypothetical protein